MEPKELCWNSRTGESIIKADRDFREIIGFLGVKDPDKFIMAFYSYFDKETKAFMQVIKKLFEEIRPKNFQWLDKEISFSENTPEKSPEKILEELRDIPDYHSGVVTLFEPIDYGYVDEMRKYGFHMSLTNLFSSRNFKLFLFGNIAYDLHYVQQNSPLNQYVKESYKISGYKDNEIRFLSAAQKNIFKKISDKCEDGFDIVSFDVVSSLENFWEEINLEKRVVELVERFMEVPIKTEIERQAMKKLSGLQQFLKNKGELVKGQIKPSDDGGKIIMNVSGESDLFKAYFDRTALFNIERIASGQKYIFTPKEIFKAVFSNSDFMNKKIDVPQEPDEKTNEKFKHIADFFKARKPMFLLGTGTSLMSGAPDHQNFIRQISGIDKDDKLKPKELFLEFDKYMEKIATVFDIRQKMIPLLSQLKPSIGHFFLAQLVERKYTDVIITTNYDTLIEDSLMDFGIRSSKFLKIVGSTDKKWDWKWVNDLQDDPLKIFKICGDVLHGEKFAIKSKDAETFISTAVKELETIIKTPKRNMFIILGHALKENSIFDLLFKYSTENTVIVYVNCNPFEAALDNGEPCPGFRKAVKAKKINKNGARIFEIDNPHYGLFDNFMERLYHELKVPGK
ncbi:MAG: SIR2 family protein [Candidatus Aminicenantes bacterium]|nr:SIR2 family protein [Candidatus Aminicenantes bacterium]